MRVLRIVQQRLAFGAVRVEGLDRAGVLRMQSRLGALQHLGESIPPGVGDPRAVGGCGVRGAVTVTDRQLDIPLQPLQVGHCADVTEVRLRRVGHRSDQLVTTRRDGVGVTGNLVEQSPAPGCRVVDLVNVCAQLAAAGSHAAVGLSSADPVIGSAGLDQHLLDRRRRGRLQRRHGRGSDENPVYRHLGESVRGGPGARQVLRRPLGCADAATDADGDVRQLPQIGVRGQQ